MPKHIDFRDFVLSRSFKGYSFNQQKMLVEGKYCLEANETAQISEQGLKMGFSSKREVEKEINSIIKGVDIHGLHKNVSELRCLDCLPGTIVDITFEYDMKASLLYLGDFVFLVCMDSSGFLHYNDRLTAVVGGFCTSSSSYFLIKDFLNFDPNQKYHLIYNYLSENGFYRPPSSKIQAIILFLQANDNSKKYRLSNDSFLVKENGILKIKNNC